MDLTAELHRRHFDTQLHTAWLDEETGVAVFPLWNLSGQMRGYQQYRPSIAVKKNNDPGPAFKNFVFTCGRRVVTVCDNDENGSGRKLAKYGHQSVFCEDGKDLGDASEDYVDFLLNKFA